MNAKETLLIVVQFMFPESPMTHQAVILPSVIRRTVYLMIVNLQAVVVAQTVLVVKVMMGRLVDMMDPISQAAAETEHGEIDPGEDPHNPENGDMGGTCVTPGGGLPFDGIAADSCVQSPGGGGCDECGGDNNVPCIGCDPDA